MERTEFIQRLFIAAMQNSHISDIKDAVESVVKCYDELIGASEDAQSQNDDTEQQYYLSLEGRDRNLYYKMQQGCLNKIYVGWLCKESRTSFKSFWEKLINSDAVLSRPKFHEYKVKKWEKQADGDYGYTYTDKTKRITIGQYKFDTNKVCQLILEQRPRNTMFIDNYLKYNS